MSNRDRNHPHSLSRTGHWNTGYAAPVWSGDPGAGQRSAPNASSGCFRCGLQGHFARNCPQASRRRPAPGYNGSDGRFPQAPEQARQVKQKDGVTLCYLRMKVNNRPTLALLDTGCDSVLIPGKFARRCQIRPTTKNCTAANGTPIPVKGETDLPVTFGSVTTTVTGLVTDYVNEVTLSLRWLYDNQASWDFATGVVTIRQQEHRLVAKRKSTLGCRRVVVDEDTVVPANSQMNIPARMVFDRLPTSVDDEDWATETSQVKGCQVARVLLPRRINDLPVRVLNTTEVPVQLCRNTIITDAVPLKVTGVRMPETTTTQHEVKEATAESIVDELVAGVDPSISETTKDSLRNLLERYSMVFSKSEYDLGWTDVVTHTIDTGEAKPFR